MTDGPGHGGPPAPQEAEPEQEAVPEQPTIPLPAPSLEPPPNPPLAAEPEQPTLPLPAPKPTAWHQRIAALLPTQRLPAIPRLPAVRRPPTRWLARWGLILVAVVVLAGAGGALYKVSHAPEDAASQLCADAQAGHYDAAYGLLGESLQAQESRGDFARIGAALDTVDGRIISCTATSYDYALGSSRAAISVHIVRADGRAFGGHVEMADVSGWKVASLDPSLTGASIGALDVALRFCDALRAGDTSALLGLSGASAVLGDAQQLAANLSTWQQVDGSVTGCALAGTGGSAGASATAAQLTVGVSRARRGTALAEFGLMRAAAGWRVTAIGANLLGSDLGPLALGQRFCSALAAGNYAGAYALFSPTYAAQVTLNQFIAAFASLGGSWSCSPRLNTYAVSGPSGSYDLALTLSGAGQPLALTATLRFTLTGGSWAIQDVEPQGQ